MKLSRTIAYAIQAMLRLAQADEGVPVPCSQLAGDDGMPERFLLQILRKLVTRGLLHSTRGVDGGYYLARPPTQITLRDIIEAFEDALEHPSLPETDGLSSPSRARILKTLQHASHAARQELQKLTLARILHAGDATERSAARLAGRIEVSKHDR